MDWTNLNPLINSIADEQGVEVGSTEWVNGGIKAYSGTTGEHPAYGWRHDHKLNEDWVRAVIANYAHRRCYYGDSPKRLSGYNDAGRPKGWTPEDISDLSNGKTAYLTSTGIVQVSGPDILHFQLGPLFAVYDVPGQYTVKVKGKDYDASYIAGILVSMLCSSLAGMINNIPKYNWGERGIARIVDTAIQASSRGLLNTEDSEVIFKWINEVAFPFYETAPGVTINKNPSLINGLQNTRIYNGLYWTLPSLYDLSKFDDSEVLKNIVDRLSQWLSDLEETLPLSGANIAYLSLPLSLFDTTDNKPVPSLKEHIDKSNIQFTYNWEIWGFRAVCVAESVVKTPALENLRKYLYDKFKNQKISEQEKCWLVNENREYIL